MSAQQRADEQEGGAGHRKFERVLSGGAGQPECAATFHRRRRKRTRLDRLAQRPQHDRKNYELQAASKAAVPL